LEAEPTALEMPCPVTGLYPFQLAASGLAMSEKRFRQRHVTASVDMCFTLLRKVPHVMKNLIDGITTQQPWDYDDVYNKIQQDKLKLAQIEYECFLKSLPLQAENEKLEREYKKRKTQ
jgi:hypothetical protein